MTSLLSVLLIVVVAAVIIWLIRQIPWPAGLEIINWIFILIVVIAAILKLWPLL